MVQDIKNIFFFTFGVNFAQEAWLICSSAFNAAGLTVVTIPSYGKVSKRYGGALFHL